MNRPDWPVLTEGIRPAGSPTRCFYCDAKIGGQHASDCVIRSRTVVVKATIEYTIEVPEDWTADAIESHRNDGSWCASNMLVELEEIVGEDEEDFCEMRKCLCGQVKFAFVREATAEDEERDGVKVGELPT